MAMSILEVINAAEAHLLRQGAWALQVVEDKPLCCYLTEDGKRCAIGGLPGFPQELEDFRGDVYDLSPSAKFLALFDNCPIGVLKQVQSRMHDSLASNKHITPLFSPEKVKLAAHELREQYCGGEGNLTEMQ